MFPTLAMTVRREVLIGGVTKAELLLRLEAAGVLLNDFARILFAHPQFTTAAASSSVASIEVCVADLGLPMGGTFAEISQQASAHALSLCPLELGPHLRLQFVHQPEGHVGQPPSQNRAPPGSITVVSQPIAEDEDTPRGFYLRRIDGAPWLRGYRSWAGHKWSPEDRLVFCQASHAA